MTPHLRFILLAVALLGAAGGGHFLTNAYWSQKVHKMQMTGVLLPPGTVTHDVSRFSTAEYHHPKQQFKFGDCAYYKPDGRPVSVWDAWMVRGTNQRWIEIVEVGYAASLDEFYVTAEQLQKGENAERDFWDSGSRNPKYTKKYPSDESSHPAVEAKGGE